MDKPEEKRIYSYIREDHLKSGATKSCGCYRREVSSGRHEPTRVTHGMTHTRLYNIFKNMKARCYNPKNPKYPIYGGKGITIWSEWLKDRTKFFSWALSHGYSDNLTIDRIDGNKGYYPENCRWVTIQQQNRNLSSNRHIDTPFGNMVIAEFAERLKQPYYMVYNMIYDGYSPLEIYNRYVQDNKNIIKEENNGI